ncbi:hypothetical protein [Listeria grayi]|nr:hypothetical protein [Listeria grayi]
MLNNTVRQNNYTGIAVGGYDSSVGGIKMLLFPVTYLLIMIKSGKKLDNY